MVWREHVVELEDKKYNVLPFGKRLQYFKTPHADLARELDRLCHQMKGAFTPMYSNEKASKATSFTTSPETVIYFSWYGAPWNIIRSMSTAPSKEMQRKAFPGTTEFTALCKHFCMTFRQISSTLEKSINKNTSLLWVPSQSRSQEVLEKSLPAHWWDAWVKLKVALTWHQ